VELPCWDPLAEGSSQKGRPEGALRGCLVEGVVASALAGTPLRGGAEQLELLPVRKRQI
jgi:hypothetical protein